MSNKVYDWLKFSALIVIPVAACVAAIITAVRSGGDPASIVLSIGEALAALLVAALTVVSRIWWTDKEIIEK